MRRISQRLLLAFAPWLLATPMAFAQQPVNAPAPGSSSSQTMQPGRPKHEADGLVFATAGISENAASGYLTIKYAIQNRSKEQKYIILYGSSHALADSGANGRVIIEQTSGIAYCNMQFNDSQTLQNCKSGQYEQNGGGSRLENYTAIEPGDILQAALTYNFGYNNLSSAKSASFVLKALVRTGTADQNSLDESGGNEAAGPVHIVNVNFAFLPIGQSN